MGEEVSQSEDALGPDDIAVIIANEIFLGNQIPVYLAQSYLFFSFNGAVDASHFAVNPTLNTDQSAALSATVSWDLSGTGFPLTYIALEAPQGPFTSLTVYQVTPDEVFQSGSLQQITTLDGSAFNIVTFFSLPFGQPPPPGAPEYGSTIMLFGASLAGLTLLRYWLKSGRRPL